MSVELVPLGTMTMKMKQTVLMRNTPVGSRVIVEFSEIRWEGERVHARQRGSLAGDWLSVGPEGTAILEMRFTLETQDGAVIYIHGSGRTDSATFAQGSPIYFSPFFETNDERYAYLNRVAAVAKGTLAQEVLTLELYEVR